MNITNDDGYTLLELMVVILIVGILVSLAIATYAGIQNNGYDTQAESDLRNGVTAAKAYYTANESSYRGVDAAALADEAIGINFGNGEIYERGYVYVSAVTPSSVTLSEKSASGRVFTAVLEHLAVTYDF